MFENDIKVIPVSLKKLGWSSIDAWTVVEFLIRKVRLLISKL